MLPSSLWACSGESSLWRYDLEEYAILYVVSRLENNWITFYDRLRYAIEVREGSSYFITAENVVKQKGTPSQ